MLLVWQGLVPIARGCVPPPQVSPQEGGRVAVVCDDHAILADLTVTIFLTERVAEVVGTILIGGSVLPGSRGADHVVAGHRCRLN